jgi:hypothetical protein
VVALVVVPLVVLLLVVVPLVVLPLVVVPPAATWISMTWVEVFPSASVTLRVSVVEPLAAPGVEICSAIAASFAPPSFS